MDSDHLQYLRTCFDFEVLCVGSRQTERERERDACQRTTGGGRTATDGHSLVPIGVLFLEPEPDLLQLSCSRGCATHITAQIPTTPAANNHTHCHPSPPALVCLPIKGGADFLSQGPGEKLKLPGGVRSLKKRHIGRKRCFLLQTL